MQVFSSLQKKDSTLRPVIDFSGLNSITIAEVPWVSLTFTGGSSGTTAAGRGSFSLIERALYLRSKKSKTLGSKPFSEEWQEFARTNRTNGTCDDLTQPKRACGLKYTQREITGDTRGAKQMRGHRLNTWRETRRKCNLRWNTSNTAENTRKMNTTKH